ncbi:MAG TPA: hypothetical protein VFN26_12395 [Candidatus Acidoferrum sp.]|nr:hypothetical protein [Candidatus Acidoferrum sp.]
MTTGDVWGVAGAVLASLGGGSVIVAAFSNWLGKLWADRLMEKERAQHAKELEKLRSSLERSTRLLQGEIEKTLFVSKTHFETEFKALAVIWRRVAQVRARMNRLHLHEALVLKGEGLPSLLFAPFGLFDTAVNHLIHAIDYQSPFYPNEIFQQLEAVLEVALLERQEFGASLERNDFNEGRYRQGKERFAQILQAAEAVSSLIRERISKLSVYGGTFAIDTTVSPY